MATIAYTETRVLQGGAEEGSLVVWPSMQNGDDGQPYSRVTWADRSVQIEGNFGLNGALQIQGSNDGSNYRPLNDPQGNALTVISAKVAQVTEASAQIRPQVTGGDITTSLTVTMLVLRRFR